MVMVTGVLADFGRRALADSTRNLQPEIVFRPSGNAVKSNGSVVYVTQPVKVTPTMSTGAWTADLEPTTTLQPHVWYAPTIRWLDPDGNFIYEDDLPWRLYVPGTGGAFADLIRVSPNPLQVWVVDGGAIPDEAQPNDLLFDPTTDNLYQLS